MWHIHIMEHNLAIKGNKALIHATIWMHLENTALSERSQKQSTKYGLPWVREQGKCGSTGFLLGVVSVLELGDDNGCATL